MYGTALPGLIAGRGAAKSAARLSTYILNSRHNSERTADVAWCGGSLLGFSDIASIAVADRAHVNLALAGEHDGWASEIWYRELKGGSCQERVWQNYHLQSKYFLIALHLTYYIALHVYETSADFVLQQMGDDPYQGSSCPAIYQESPVHLSSAS
jgi:hypothetical protein